MGKKYIMVNGEKIFIQEEAEEKDINTDEEVDAQISEATKKLAEGLKKELGLDRIDALSQTVEKFMSQNTNSKLRELLKGKDLFTQKDQLTKEEKIVGFYHALVTRDEAAVKALSEGTAADGGYLFPNEFLAELIKPLNESPRARSLCRVIPMKRDQIDIPTLANRPKVYWTAENAAKTTTTAAFGTANLTARKAAAILYASDELIEDSTEIDVVQLIISLFADAIGIEQDRVILAGNGTTEPTGLFTAVTASTIAGITCSGNLDFDDITDLVYSLKTKYRTGSSFIIHPTNVKELRKLKDNDGRYLWSDALTASGFPTLMGYPVHEFYDAPESAILFGNYKLGYWVGDRKEMSVKISNDTETAFTKDQTAIRGVFRMAGNVVLAEAMKALKSIP